MIEITNLRKSFGEKTAVDIDKLTMSNDTIIGLVGNNGAGKTTLFRLILDLMKADEGEVKVTRYIKTSENDNNPANEDIITSESESWKDFIGAYIDDGFLIDFLTPEEYFDFIRKISNIDKSEFEERLKIFSGFMGGEVLGQNKLIRDLSAGNKHKVGIISAMISEPEILILDEPFNFLDPSSQNILKHLLIEYHKQNNTTIIVSSHNLSHTVDISTRIVLMEKGKIIKDIANDNMSASQELEDYFNKETNF